jgi:thioredoxin-related protein
MIRFLVIAFLSLLIITTFVFFDKSQSVAAEKEILIQTNSYQDALLISKEQNKKIFILFKNEQCHWCENQKQVLKDIEVTNSLSSYIVYHVDTNKEKEVSLKYNVKAVPVLLLINNEEKVIKKNVGYLDKNKFIEWIQK